MRHHAGGVHSDDPPAFPRCDQRLAGRIPSRYGGQGGDGALRGKSRANFYPRGTMQRRRSPPHRNTCRATMSDLAPRSAATPSISPNVLILTIAAFALFLFAPRVLADGDTYWHIAAGDWMLAHFRVPRTDPFAFTTQGMVWVAHEWLAEVLFALAFRAGGWGGVVVLTAAAAATAMFLLARALERFVAPQLAYGMLMLALLTLMPGMLARPHILALPVLVAWMVGLVRARAEGRAPSGWLALAMLAWSNLHGGYMIGLAMAGAMALEAVCTHRGAWRGWAVFLLAASMAACITPLGLDGILFPFRMLGLRAVAGIQEWQPPDFRGMEPVEFVLLAALALGLYGGVRLPWFRVLLFLGLVHATLQASRFQMQLSVIGFLLLAPALGVRFPPRAATVGRGAGYLLASMLLGLSLVRAALPITRVDTPGYPLAALASVPADIRALPVFNAYRFGGFLIFHHLRVFVDSRADLYGDAFLADYLAIQEAHMPTVNAAFARHAIAWTILEPGTPLVAWLDTQPGWRRHYADGFAVVHMRDNASFTRRP